MKFTEDVWCVWWNTFTNKQTQVYHCHMVCHWEERGKINFPYPSVFELTGPTLSASSLTPKKEVLTRTYFLRDQVPDCPDFTCAKNKLPSWDKYFCTVTPLWAWVIMTISVVEKHWLSGKEKFWVKQSVKKVMLTVFWDMKGLITINFFENGVNVNSVTYCQFFRQNSSHLFNDFRTNPQRQNHDNLFWELNKVIMFVWC